MPSQSNTNPIALVGTVDERRLLLPEPKRVLPQVGEEGGTLMQQAEQGQDGNDGNFMDLTWSSSRSTDPQTVTSLTLMPVQPLP